MNRSFLTEESGLPRPSRLAHRYLMILLPLAGLAVGCAGPQWYLDPGFAERLARQENKPLLFYFKAWDSTQHRNMNTTVFNNPAVTRELLGTVKVELEFAWSAPYDARYKVHRSQVCVMCKPDGRMVEPALYVNPVPTPEQFLEWLKRTKMEAMPPQASPTTRAATQPNQTPVQPPTPPTPAAAQQKPPA